MALSAALSFSTRVRPEVSLSLAASCSFLNLSANALRRTLRFSAFHALMMCASVASVMKTPCSYDTRGDYFTRSTCRRRRRLRRRASAASPTPR